MKSLKKLTLRPAVIVLSLAVALTVAAKCDTDSTACAATTTLVAASPPEPITDGSYKDSSYEEGEAPPEPVEDGSYQDGSEHESGIQGEDTSGC